jgi:multidrug efflux pump subunit AcrB
MTGLIRFFARSHLISNIITLLILALGILSLFKIQRDIWPRVDFKTTIINTVYPGASPQQVEKLIVTPIEEAIREVDGIKRVLSTAVQNVAITVIELDENARNLKDTNEDIQSAIDRIIDLPMQAEKPIVTKIESGRYPVIELKVQNTENKIDIKFRDSVKLIADEMSFVPLVAKVEKVGLEDKEYVIETDIARLKKYQTSLSEIITAIATHNVSIPSGNFKLSDSSEVLVRVESEITKPEDLEKIFIRSNTSGYGVQIKDVAKVKYDLVEPERLYRFNERPTISLSVLKKINADALTLVENVKTKVEDLNKRYEGVLQITTSNDFSIYLKNRLSSLSSNLFLGLFLVLIILTLYLPFPVTFAVAIGIPVAMLATLFVFQIFGQTLNLISMIGLIIVTGMVVDDAIVVCENIWRNVELGKPLSEASREGAIEVLLPVTASVLTTVLFFAPMLTMTGVFGSFVYHIPTAVILALSFSWLEAFFLMPSHFESWIGPFLKNYIKKSEGKNFLRGKYINYVKFSLRHRYLIAFVSLIIIIGTGIFIASTGRFILFPPEGIEQFYIKIEAPTETPLNKMIDYVAPIERIALGISKDELKDVYTTLGIIQQDNFDPQTRRGSNYANIRVSLTPQNMRAREAQDIIDTILPKILETASDKLKISYELQRQGPPQGRDISIDISGKSFDVLQKVASELKPIIESYAGIKDFQNSYIEGKKEWFAEPNSEAMQAAGINSQMVSQTLRASFEGFIASSVRDSDEEMDIRVKMEQKYQNILSALSDISVGNLQGQLISLGKVAEFKNQNSVVSINHLNFKRVINISASVDLTQNTAAKIVSELKPKVEQVMQQFEGYEASFGGEDKDTQESIQSLFEAFLIAMILIYFLLVITFNSLLQPVLIMVSIPFGFVGSALALMMHGRPFSFMGLLGIIALGGVIVNNAIVIIDFVNEKRKKGYAIDDSIIESCEQRFRPILLTTATTVFGLLPTAYGEQIAKATGLGGGDPFIIPIAISLGWGLAFGSVMTLLFFPAITRIVDDGIGLSKKIFG